MKKKLISIIVCPKCKSHLKLEITKRLRDRIIEGKLLCKRCSNTFAITNDIVCFKEITRRDKDRKKIQETQKMFLGQEFKKKWLQYFTKEEFTAVEEEWSWMIDKLELRNSRIHLDWATGTSRFLRNILGVIKGEIIALESDYTTCLGLRTFLKEIRKYSKVTIICSDARNMPLADNVVDSISSWHGLDEPKISKAIDESKRILKKNKVLVVSGMFYEKNSQSLKIAIKEGIEFAGKNKAYQYFKKLNFKDIDYKIFYRGKWLEHESFLPRIGDDYTCYGINGRK